MINCYNFKYECAKRQGAIGGINGVHERLGKVAGDDFYLQSAHCELEWCRLRCPLGNCTSISDNSFVLINSFLITLASIILIISKLSIT